MMLPSQILAIVVLTINVIVSHALWATNDTQCDVEKEILFNDTELNSLYPRNVSCQSTNDTYCAIDFDNVTGVDEYYKRCYELQGRIILFNIEAKCNVAEDVNSTNITMQYYSYKNDPLCLGSNCSLYEAYQQTDVDDRVVELGVSSTAGCQIGVVAYVQTSLSGSCAAETNTLRTALAGTYTEMKCPMNGTTSSPCELDYGPTSKQYQSTCLAMGGQLFIAANKTADCLRNDGSGGSTSYFYSESNLHYCFAASCTPKSVMEENDAIQNNWVNRWLPNYDTCEFSYDALTAVNSTIVTMSTSNADPSWTYITASIVAVAVSVTVTSM
jgi:hypothetical protein